MATKLLKLKRGPGKKVLFDLQDSKPIRTASEKKTKKKVLQKKALGRVFKTGEKRKKSSKLCKFSENPIIKPIKSNNWESWQTFNPAALFEDGKIHFFYRAIGEDGLSRFGYAVSNDGFQIDKRLRRPAYQHRRKCSACNYFSFASGGSWGGCEDPRIVRIKNEDTLYMTYTACDEGLRVALTSIKVKDFLRHKWNWKAPKLISPAGEVHKNWVIFPEKINGKYAILHSISPKISIAYRDSLDFKEEDHIQSHYSNDGRRKNCWDSWTRGAGPAPIKTKYGWLLLYHGMDRRDPSKYKVGAMLLDLKDPTKILSRSKEPILEPDEIYENDGFKAGVVYASGAVIKGGKIFVYYGGADNYVCVAYADCEEFLNDLRKGAKPKFKKKIRKDKK